MTGSEQRRPDFAQTLVHLTRERYDAPWTGAPKEKCTLVTPLEVLKEILTSGVIEGGHGFIKGKRPAACFTEMPLSAVCQFASTPDQPDGLRFYGVAFGKTSAFELGARPVIYLPDEEGDWIPSEEKWRHVRFDEDVDFTHLREWRAPDSLPLTGLRGIHVLVWSPSEVPGILELDSPVKHLIRSVIPMQHLRIML